MLSSLKRFSWKIAETRYFQRSYRLGWRNFAFFIFIVLVIHFKKSIFFWSFEIFFKAFFRATVSQIAFICFQEPRIYLYTQAIILLRFLGYHFSTLLLLFHSLFTFQYSLLYYYVAIYTKRKINQSFHWCNQKF